MSPTNKYIVSDVFTQLYIYTQKLLGTTTVRSVGLGAVWVQEPHQRW